MLPKGMMPNWQLEGGVHNVARRDGIGSLMLEAHHVIAQANQLGFTKWLRGLQPLSSMLLKMKATSAWQDERSTDDFPNQRRDYLVNLSPAYGIKGGMHEVLSDSSAKRSIQEPKLNPTRHCIMVSIWLLCNSMEKQIVRPDERILLNISRIGIHAMGFSSF